MHLEFHLQVRIGSLVAGPDTPVADDCLRPPGVDEQDEEIWAVENRSDIMTGREPQMHIKETFYTTHMDLDDSRDDSSV